MRQSESILDRNPVNGHPSGYQHGATATLPAAGRKGGETPRPEPEGTRLPAPFTIYDPATGRDLLCIRATDRDGYPGMELTLLTPGGRTALTIDADAHGATVTFWDPEGEGAPRYAPPLLELRGDTDHGGLVRCRPADSDAPIRLGFGPAE
jgi:hypothetical protein